MVFPIEVPFEYASVGEVERQGGIGKAPLACDSQQHCPRFLTGAQKPEHLVDNVRLGVFVGVWLAIDGSAC